jgi:hypothetical protein
LIHKSVKVMLKDLNSTRLSFTFVCD